MLTKSKIMSFIQCEKKAYLENHHPEYAQDQSNAVLSLNGQIFEDFVKQAYPDAVDLKNLDLMEALDRIREITQRNRMM